MNGSKDMHTSSTQRGERKYNMCTHTTLQLVLIKCPI